MFRLIQVCIEMLKLVGSVGLVVTAIFLTSLVALPVGRYLGKLFDVDDQIFIAGCFFALLAVEVYACDRFQQWWDFRKLRS